MFMKNSAGLSPFLLFMSIMGGLKIFGVAGIFYGPLILGFVVIMLALYREEYSDMLKGNTDNANECAAALPASPSRTAAPGENDKPKADVSQRITAGKKRPENKNSGK